MDRAYITHSGTGTISRILGDGNSHLLLLRRDSSNSTSRKGSNGERETHLDRITREVK